MSPKHDLTDGAVRMIACPHCRQPVRWEPASRFRPFCSERCKLIDLGKWANEEYRVEQREQDSGNQETQA